MAEQLNSPQPFFSIGVPTYDRHDLLKEALASILAQTFTDFEVIVGNDYTKETLTPEMLGITDPRVRFVNHGVNLREVGNMNALLSLARGRYFTWLFDDDLYESTFLETGYATLTAAGFPDAFFSSYRVITGAAAPKPLHIPAPKPELFTGCEFLSRYSAQHPDVISTCGLFRTERLRETLGGFTVITDTAIGLYSEYLLLVRCGLLDRIALVNAPLVIFRAHSASWGESNRESDSYPSAGRRLVELCSATLDLPTFPRACASILIEMCKTHLFTFFHRVVRDETTRGNPKIVSALRYRLRYFKEVHRTARQYAHLTGTGLRSSFAIFNPFLTDNHIYPPVWDGTPSAGGGR